MSAPQAPQLEQVSLKRILSIAQGDRVFVGEMIQEFRSDTARASAALSTGLANADTETVRKALHSLRGLSATVEAAVLGDLARHAEQLLREGDLASFAPVAAEFPAAIEAASSALDRLFRAMGDEQSTG